MAPLFDAVFDRQAGAPDTYQTSFGAPSPESGFLCIDNGVNDKTSVTSGSIDLNGAPVVSPQDFKHGEKGSSIQASVSLLLENSLRVQLAGKPGSEIRVRVFAAAPAP